MVFKFGIDIVFVMLIKEEEGDIFLGVFDFFVNFGDLILVGLKI